jgi:hypothetical protein
MAADQNMSYFPIKGMSLKLRHGRSVLLIHIKRSLQAYCAAISISGLNVPSQATNPTITTAATHSTSTLRRNALAATAYCPSRNDRSNNGPR